MSKSQLPLMIGIGTRIRKSPYYDSNLKYGVTGFTVYNKMYLQKPISHFSNFLGVIYLTKS